MDKLTVERTQPVQGQAVEVYVYWNDEEVGGLHLPFQAWLKFKRLLENGIAQDAREQHPLQLKLKIAGVGTVNHDAGKEYRGVRATAVVKEEVIELPEPEDAEDAEDLAAIARLEQVGGEPIHEVKSGAIRNLRRVVGDDE